MQAAKINHLHREIINSLLEQQKQKFTRNSYEKSEEYRKKRAIRRRKRKKIVKGKGKEDYGHGHYLSD